MPALTSIHPEKVLFIALAPSGFYRSQLIKGVPQLFIGPDVDSDDFIAQAPRLVLRNEWLDAKRLLPALNELDWIPDITFVKADATCRNHIQGISTLPGLKVLLMGDTHHLRNPLQTMLAYAKNEPWDLISSEHDRHHLPLFFQAGLSKLIWLPCFSMNPIQLLPQVATDPRPVFVGSLSSHHRQRQRTIARLQAYGVDIMTTVATQEQAAQLYNRHSVSLNVSLNGDFNFRIMEVLASGGCLLTDRLGSDSGLDLLLEEDVHYLAYGTAIEAAEKIRRLQADPQMRFAIAQAGHKRFWSCVSPELQTQALLETLSGRPTPLLFRAPR